MANGRLLLVEKKAGIYYQEGSPLLLEAGALYIDRETQNSIVQLKWRNLDQREVSAAAIEIRGADSFGENIEPVQFQYNRLKVSKGFEFGVKTPVQIKNNKVAKFDVVLKAVSFSDETVWKNDSEEALQPLPEAKKTALQGELLEQYRRDLLQKGYNGADQFSTQHALGLWQCGCGSWQPEDKNCYRCGASLEALTELSDSVKLEEHLSEYKTEQERLRIEAEKKAEEERVKAEEERKKAEEEREKAVKKFKKIMRISAISFLSVAALVAAILILVKVIIPGSNYQKAINLRNSGKYEEAVKEFQNLGSYKDASEQILATYYAEGEAKRAAQEWDGARDAFRHAGKYSDAFVQIQATYYAEGEARMQAGDWPGARKGFIQAGKYSDAAEQIKAAYYGEGEEKMLAKDWTGALIAFKHAGTYKGAAEKINAVYYAEGEDKRAAHDWEGARQAFRDAGRYSDAPAQINETTYQEASALEASGDYEGAGNKFLQLGDYKDSYERAFKVYYDLGIQKREAGEWEESVAAFGKVEAYSDAAEQIKATHYAEGEAKRAAQDWDGARIAFEKAGDYSDAAEQIKETTYQEASVLEATGDQEGAYRLFIGLGEYNDSFERANKPYYELGVAKRDAGEWDAARTAFEYAGTYSDAVEQIKETTYQEAAALEATGDQEGAYQLFIGLGEYKDSLERANKPYYELGVAKRDAGEWDAAITAFKHAGTYSDAETQISETDYQHAKSLMDSGDYNGACVILVNLKGYRDVDSLLKNDSNLATAFSAIHAAKLKPYQTVGNYVTFGTYPQTSTGTDQTPIEWLVLDYDEANHKALLLSRYGLDTAPYNKDNTAVSWGSCYLRAWLNGEFLKKAFSSNEQSAILTTTVDNSTGNTDSGDNTRDQIFLLSHDEASSYLGLYYMESNIKTRVTPTAYARGKGTYVSYDNQTEDGKPAAYWWLRSPYRTQGDVVEDDGSYYYINLNVDGVAIRPALWLDLSSDYFDLPAEQHEDSPSTAESQNTDATEAVEKNSNGWYVSDDGMFAIHPYNIKQNKGGYIISIQLREEGTNIIIANLDLDFKVEDNGVKLKENDAIRDFKKTGSGEYSFKVACDVPLGKRVVTAEQDYTLTLN